MAKTKGTTQHSPPNTKLPSVGQRIIEGLEEAIASTRGENDRARVTLEIPRRKRAEEESVQPADLPG